METLKENTAKFKKRVVLWTETGVGLNVGYLKSLGRLGRVQEQNFLVCSAVLEAFGIARNFWSDSACKV